MEHVPYFSPSPQFGYTIVAIDDHPWNTLITMKEVLRLEPGSLKFVGPGAKEHAEYWKIHQPALMASEAKPVFQLDTKVVHPHQVETKPRRPFEPWTEPR